MDVLDGLEAGDEVEPATLEDLRREESLVNERPDVGPGRQTGCVRWLDPLHTTEACGEQLLQKSSVAGADVEGRAQAARRGDQGGEDRPKQAPVGPSRPFRLLRAVVCRGDVGAGERLRSWGRAGVDEVAHRAGNEAVVHVLGLLAGGEGEAVEGCGVDPLFSE